MRSIVWLLICALIVCVGTSVVSLAKTDLPPADGKALWTYITKTNPYTKWEIWPGTTKMHKGQSPHGAYLTIYGNDIAIKAAKAKTKKMPNGAIIVKDNFGMDKKTLAVVTPMFKVKGFNPQGGDWFWGKYGPDGKMMATGKVEGCIKCHTAKKDKDWIFNWMN